MQARKQIVVLMTLHMVIASFGCALAAKAAKTVRKSYSPPPFPFHKPDSDKESIPLTGEALESWNNGEKAFRALDFKTAVSQFQKVVELNPNYSRGHLRLGSAMAAADDYDNAETELDKAIKLDPKDYLPHLVLGRVTLVKKDEKAGNVEAQKAFDLNPWACAAFLDFANQFRFDPH